MPILYTLKCYISQILACLYPLAIINIASSSQRSECHFFFTVVDAPRIDDLLPVKFVIVVAWPNLINRSQLFASIRFEAEKSSCRDLDSYFLVG